MTSKYKAVKTVVNGITFDSKREAVRYEQLLRMKESGLIENLKLQPEYVLQEGYEIGGHRIRPIKYRADFYYFDKVKRESVVEDVKGMRTEVYKLKKKLFEYKYQMQITEV